MQKNKQDNLIELLLEHDLTANHVEEFHAEIDKFLKHEDDMAELIINLSQTKNIDSVGVTFIVSLYKQMKEEGILFRIIGASKDVKSLFKLMKLDQLFDLEEA